MRRLRIGVLDLVTKAPNRSLYARLMHANLASIMPQVISSPNSSGLGSLATVTL